MDLKDYRKKIDEIDGEILRLFEARMALAGKISAWKQANKQSVFQPEREKQKLESIKQQADPKLLSYDRALFETLFELSRSYQEERLRP